MLNPESLADLTARRDAIKDEIRDRNEELKHIDALLSLWRARKKGKRGTVRAPRPAQPATGDPTSAGELRHDGTTKQDRIVKEVLKHLLDIPTHSAAFPDVFRLLDPELVGTGNGAREYARTSILRLGGIYGVVYGKGGRLWLNAPPNAGFLNPFESVRSPNPFESVAQGTSPFTLVVRDTHD